MLTEATVRDYTARLASREPTPGGGSAAALLGALGTALGEMVCNFTSGKEGFAELEGPLADLAQYRVALLDLADRDAEAYAGVGAAYKLPKETEAQQIARAAAIQLALKASAAVPLAAVEQLAAVVALLPAVLEHGNRNLVSDVGVAADFCQSAMRCAWLNVEVNLAGLLDEEYKAGVRARLEELISAAEQTAADVWDQTVELVQK